MKTTAKRRRLKYRKGGLAGYLKEVEAMLPLMPLKTKYDEKFESNSLFDEFFTLLQFDKISAYFGHSPGLDFVTLLQQKYQVDWHVYFNKARDFFEHKASNVSVVLQ